MKLTNKDIGRKFRRRDGAVRTIVTLSGGKTYPFADEEGEMYTPGGRVIRGHTHRGDLVERLPREPEESTMKPWDKLRAPAEKPPIKSGKWTTTSQHAWVQVDTSPPRESPVPRVQMQFANGRPVGNVYLDAPDLRELAEFCNELADQLDRK